MNTVKHCVKRVLALLLTAVMLCTMLPAAALAALLDNTPAYNGEILAALTDLVGSEDEAERYYDVLERYGLLDEDGSVAECWTIEMDGQELTLDELKEILSGDFDPGRYLWVDGMAVTLGDVKTMLEIEEYVSYVREKYFSDGEWTAAQKEAYASLREQLLTEGITLRGAGLIGPSGVNHSARVGVAKTAVSDDGLTVTYTASLTGATAGQVVRFDWRAVSGSRPASGSGTVTLTADESGAAAETFAVTLGKMTVAEASNMTSPAASVSVYYVDCDNIRNALFTGDRDTLAIRSTAGGTVPAEKFPTTGDFSYQLRTEQSGFILSDQEQLAIMFGITTLALMKDFQLFIPPRDPLISAINIDDHASLQANRTFSGGELKIESDAGTLLYAAGGYKPQAQSTYGPPEFYSLDNIRTSVQLIATSIPHSISARGRRTIAYVYDGYLPNWDPKTKHGPFHYFENKGTIWWGNPGYHQYTFMEQIDVTVEFKDMTTPTIRKIIVPDGTYFPGEVVPVVVLYSEPVKNATLTVNDQILSPAENSASNILTFPYTVQEADNTAALIITAATGTDISDKSLNLDADTDDPERVTFVEGALRCPVTLSTPIKSHAFTGMRASAGGTAAAPKMDVAVNVTDNARLTQWMGSAFTADGGVFTSDMSQMKVRVGDAYYPLTTTAETVTGGTLTASIPLPLNTGDNAVDYIAELYVDDQVVIGKTASASLAPAAFITAGDMTVSLSVKQSDGDADYEYADSSNTIYLQDNPIIRASYSLKEGDYSFSDVVWSSSDTSIANINQDGKITPTGKAGKVKFRLTATNGNVEGKSAYKETEELTFGVGLTPFLLVPNKAMQSLSGRDVTVYWSSNLCDKNGSEATAFTVTVTRGTETDPVYETTVTGTAAAPASSAVIPGEKLSFQYGAGAVNTFTVKVRAVYRETEYADAARIDLESLPARVTLDRLDSYYILDTAGSVDIGWEITNFDRFSSEDAGKLFRLRVTRGDREVYASDNPGSGDEYGRFTGSCTLSDLGVNASGSGSYRDVYTVTIQAKNGNESTWSYDSFLLYVYDADALKIWVDGADTDSLTMTNVPRLSRMTQEEILALKRDISLHNVISANYGEYAWSELADQLAWASSDNAVATVNYQQGTLYEDIRNFTYTSYRPTTDFILSGLSDGSTTVTAQHVLTGMTDSLNVNVETLKDKLYLFQCYPQTVTTLTYRDSSGAEKTVTSDADGAAAVFEADGICSDVYCRATYAGNVYLGTFYRDQLVSGERDATKLELYPCNNLELRRAAYAYLYIKNPDGTPYTGAVTFRGGVYVDGAYQSAAYFALNSAAAATLSGSADQTVSLGGDGRLEVVMDQTQWGLADNQVHAGDKIAYTFLIKQGNDATAYYPIFVDIDATVNQNAFVGSGDAVVNFRANSETEKHPFIIGQTVTARKPDTGYSSTSNVLDDTSRVGPTDSLPESDLTTVVMWWGEGAAPQPRNRLRLFTNAKKELAPDASVQSNDSYPFTDELLTTYTVPLNNSTLSDTVKPREIRSMYLEYYRDGVSLTRREDLALRVCNLLGAGAVEKSSTLTGQIQQMGAFTGTSGSGAKSMSFGDKFVGMAIDFISGDSFSVGQAFQMKISPTSDPTKFLGFVQVGLGNMSTENVTGVYADGSASSKGVYTPGFKELCLLFSAGKEGALTKYGMKYMNEYNKVLKRKGKADPSYTFGGYLETLIYFDFASGKWKMQVIDGGFHAGGGVTYRKEWNYMVGPVPFTVELSIGGTAEVSMDAITAAYLPADSTTGDAVLGNEFLTQLRIYLYLRLFAGVGFDYSVVALKLGIFGQISLDMQFEWLNRPDLKNNDGTTLLSTGAKNTENANLNGQHFKLNGQIGLEFVVKFLFISYEKVLFSYSFDLLNKATGKWDHINALWDANQKSLRASLEMLLNSGSANVHNLANGQQLLSVELAPTVERRDYLSDGGRVWGAAPAQRGLLRAAAVTDAVSTLESNTYPYADPELSADGALMVYLTDQGSADVTDTRAAFAVRNGTSYTRGGVIDNGGCGDSQLSIAGTDSFAVAAWTRQTVDLRKDAGAVLTADDQIMMMNGTEIFASVYSGGAWTTTALTDNSGADVAPVAAANAERAVVAWRSVETENAESIIDFNRKDTILYRVYENGAWSGIMTLYNGTSGTVKGITAAMMADGTAAVAYTLDTDSNDVTVADREIVYAVVDGQTNEVTRNVRATNDEKLDENPQLAAVTFPNGGSGDERFILGWYTQRGEAAGGADICLLDFDADGVTGQLLPESLSQVANDAEVSISSDFRFTKNAANINDLSLVWVERDEGTAQELSGSGAGETAGLNAGDIGAEKDVLKGVKFYTYGQNDERIGFTGALRVAEMPDATLIDHFDAYVTDGVSVTAALLGTTYGQNGATEEREAVTTGEETVRYTVPKAVSAMYTATDAYADQIEVPLVSGDFDTVKLGASPQIQMNICNNGIHPVTQLQITIGSTQTAYTGLNLLPGDMIQVWADYQVPADRVVDPDYQVQATFVGESEHTATGTVYLNYPDLQITDARILEEVEGSRTIQIKLNNRLDAALAGSGRRVQLSFWSDPSCETAIAGLPVVTVSDGASLKMIDEGGFSCQVRFDAAAYVRGEGTATKEIPESGVPVYIKAEALDGAGETVPEPVRSNNYASVTCENLRARTGQDVTLVSDLAVRGEGDAAAATVTVNLQNTRLTQTTTGNLIVSLLDENGQIVEQQQSYTGQGTENNNGLITLAGEAKDTEVFHFSEVGAMALVSYSDVLLDTDNAGLASLTFSNLPGMTLERFEEQADGSFSARAAADDLTSTTVVAVTESGLSDVKVNVGGGESAGGGNAVSQTLALRSGEINTINVTVTADNGTQRRYVLTLQNNGEPVISVDADAETGYSASVVYGDGEATVSLTAVAKPEMPGYAIAYHWYACDVNGGSLSEIPAEISDDTEHSALTVSDTIGAGVHYYVCTVTRTLLNGETVNYMSSVASVEIRKSTENAVTVSGSVADYDGQTHTLSAAAADKAGSTVLYSADGGQTWSEEVPGFVDAGVHTVQVKATNPNYEDTQIKTADVLIQGAPTLSAPEVTHAASVVYNSGDTATISLQALKNPAQAEYSMTYQWYNCDVNGENRTELGEGFEGTDSDTLTVPSSIGAGVHYYVCAVTRTLLNGETAENASSVASVEIRKSTENAVNVRGCAVYFDRTPHTLLEATAEKAGSTLLYSADGGTHWSTECPSFTAVGVHTVLVKATHPNYEDTEIKTADVMILSGPAGTDNGKVTIPVSGELETVRVTVKVSDGTAVITDTGIDSVLNADRIGIVTVDVSGLDEPVTGITIPAAMLTKIAAAAADGNGDAEGLRVVLPGGTVTFDAAALAAIAAQAVGEDLTLTLIQIEESALRAPQRDALAGADVQAVYDVRLSGAGRQISDFNGGRATVSVNHTLKEGQKPAGITVWYVSETGEKTLIPADATGESVGWIVQHFSNYALTYDAALAEACPKDETCPMARYADLDAAAWYHDGVHWALENHVMNGVGDGSFDPGGATSRAMIVTMLWRMEGEPASAYALTFRDVTDGQWYTEAIRWAAENGIVNGFSDENFGPMRELNREQLVTILCRYARYKSMEISPDTNALDDYRDASGISPWAAEAFRWAVQAGIINGVGDGCLSPGTNAGRAQVAVMLMRYATLG